MNELKKLNINLFGKSFSITTDESEAKVFHAVEIVNNLTKNIKSKTMMSDEIKVAALVALQLASELVDKNSELNLFREKTKQMHSFLGDEF